MADRFLVDLPDDLLAELKDYRHAQRLESRNDAICRLLRLALAAEKKETPDAA